MDISRLSVDIRRLSVAVTPLSVDIRPLYSVHLPPAGGVGGVGEVTSPIRQAPLVVGRLAAHPWQPTGGVFSPITRYKEVPHDEAVSKDRVRDRWPRPAGGLLAGDGPAG